MFRQSSSAANNGHDVGRNWVCSILRVNELTQESVAHVDRNVCSTGLIQHKILRRH
jgi:hypothetical protein